MNTVNLHKKINQITPITGVSIGNCNDKSTWLVHYVSEPTAEQLTQVQAIIDAYTILTPEQETANAINLSLLSTTDWKVTRHLEQKALGIPTHLTDEQYSQLLSDRQTARDAIVKEG